MSHPPRRASTWPAGGAVAALLALTSLTLTLLALVLVVGCSAATSPADPADPAGPAGPAGPAASPSPSPGEPGPAQSGPADPAPSGSHQWLTGYWHNFDNGSAVLRISEVPDAYNLIAVAFAENDPATPGALTFAVASTELGGYTDSDFITDVAAVRAQGRAVVVSVGGERGNVVVDSPAAATAFATSTYALMQTFGFDGVDIDLEHGIDAVHMADALRQLRDLAGPGLIITMAPQTIDYQATTMPYYELTTSIADILTIVNVQHYNSGSMLGCDGQVYNQGTVDFLTALPCILIESGLRPDQVGIGVPAVPGAAGGGHQSISNVLAAVDCLELATSCGAFAPTTPYGRIGGVMTWSINWDATTGYAFADALAGRLSLGQGGGAVPAPPSPAPTPSAAPPASAPPAPPGSCAAWVSGTVYTQGDSVMHDGAAYTAKWWTSSDAPGGDPYGPWTLGGSCT